MARDGRRFRWLAGGELPAQDGRLQFRSLSDLGPESFVHLLETLLAETADAWLTEDEMRYGPAQGRELLSRSQRNWTTSRSGGRSGTTLTGPRP